MDSGTEIRLFDRRRTPSNWVDVLGPTQCAVFFKNPAGSAMLAPNGQPYAKPADASCLVFDRLDAAREYCEARVLAVPHLRCEIYDSQGLARPPLMLILHPDQQEKVDSGTGTQWSRGRKLVAVTLILASVPLFWAGVRERNTNDFAIFLALNCLVWSLRFLHWNFGLQHREKERKKRLETHRKLEQGDA